MNCRGEIKSVNSNYDLKQMSVIFVLAFVLCSLQSCIAQGHCRGNHCDPNWTPYPNMVAALRGYNIITGNPIQNNGDPGFAGQIFQPTKLNALGRIELESGITASDLSNCELTMESKSFATINSYRNYVIKSSRTGMDLQIGTDTEVIAGINLKGAEISATKTIPKPFERAWGNSRDFRQLKNFFSKKHGMISTSMGICTVYEMKLDRFYLPPFTTAFKKALIQLYKARRMPGYFQRRLFRMFINEYGTHFLLKTKMGAQYAYRTMFSRRARNTLDASVLQKCNSVKGSRIFGIQLEKDTSECTKGQKKILRWLGRSNIRSTVITKGSRPTNMKKWVGQQFVPVPLQFQLSPIVNLFKAQYINNATLGIRVSAFGIRKWFVPLYFEFCKSMLLDCGVKKGCGIDDKCPIDTICTGKGKVHKCTEWSEWTCTVNCGRGTRQKRTRKCTGCRGSTYQARRHLCAPQKPCYRWPNCRIQHTRWNDEGRGDVVFLDRHHLNCGRGQTIQTFSLQRNGRGKYRYRYTCCNTPYQCKRTVSRTTDYDIRRKRGAVYLDRHHVQCKYQYLASFHLQRRGDNIRYSYSCCKVSGRRRCYSAKTRFTADGGGDDGDTVFLDRQHVRCRSGYGLSYFHLERNRWHDKWRYHYNCCKVLRY